MTRALLAVAAIGLALGCIHRFPSTVALDDPALEREWRDGLFVPPGAVRSLQRVVLARAGTELDFSVLVRARRPDHLRVVGLSDLGGTLFHVLREAGVTRVLQGSALLGDGFLTDVLVAGLAPIFLGASGEELRLVRTEAGATGLRGRVGGDELLFTRRAGGGPADRVQTGRDGRACAALEVLEWSRAADGRVVSPLRLRLGDAGGGWRLDLQVVEWSPEEGVARSS